MIDLPIQLLLASLQLLQLLQTFPRSIVDEHFLVLQLLTLARHHSIAVLVVSVLCLDLEVYLLLLLLLLLQLQF